MGRPVKGSFAEENFSFCLSGKTVLRAENRHRVLRPGALMKKIDGAPPEELMPEDW